MLNAQFFILAVWESGSAPRVTPQCSVSHPVLPRRARPNARGSPVAPAGVPLPEDTASRQSVCRLDRAPRAPANYRRLDAINVVDERLRWRMKLDFN